MTDPTHEEDPAEYERKQAAFLAAAHLSWFNTRLEQTKAIFSLAAAGVGLCVTLISQAKAETPPLWSTVWLLFASVLFGVSAGAAILVLAKNADIITKLIKDEDETAVQGLATRLHQLSWVSFVLALACIVLAEIAHIWLEVNHG